MKLDNIEYTEDIPRWFVYVEHWFYKMVFCKRRGHRLTHWKNCDTCGEYA